MANRETNTAPADHSSTSAGCAGCLFWLLAVAAISFLLLPSPAPIPPTLQMEPFEWPLPRPSTFRVVSDFRHYTLLGDVAHSLEKMLDHGGYEERAYFHIPGGFALTTRLESIDDDGSISNDRWTVDVSKNKIRSVSDYLSALFHARTGRYRAFVFLVTDETLALGNEPEFKDVQNWSKEGSVRLDDVKRKAVAIGSLSCAVFVYEFIQSGKGTNPAFVAHSAISPSVHLSELPPVHEIDTRLQVNAVAEDLGREGRELYSNAFGQPVQNVFTLSPVFAPDIVVGSQRIVGANVIVELSNPPRTLVGGADAVLVHGKKIEFEQKWIELPMARTDFVAPVRQSRAVTVKAVPEHLNTCETVQLTELTLNGAIGE